jgi:hypothetical protein
MTTVIKLHIPKTLDQKETEERCAQFIRSLEQKVLSLKRLEKVHESANNHFQTLKNFLLQSNNVNHEEEDFKDLFANVIGDLECKLHNVLVVPSEELASESDSSSSSCSESDEETEEEEPKCLFHGCNKLANGTSEYCCKSHKALGSSRKRKRVRFSDKPRPQRNIPRKSYLPEDEEDDDLPPPRKRQYRGRGRRYNGGNYFGYDKETIKKAILEYHATLPDPTAPIDWVNRTGLLVDIKDATLLQRFGTELRKEGKLPSVTY